jgi:hypothetical protein
MLAVQEEGEEGEHYLWKERERTSGKEKEKKRMDREDIADTQRRLLVLFLGGFVVVTGNERKKERKKERRSKKKGTRKTRHIIIVIAVINAIKGVTHRPLEAGKITFPEEALRLL